MLKNFLKLALRNMWKQKGYSFLNIFGLALGMACSLLILLWIMDEKSTDNYHTKGDRLYSIYERQYYDGNISAFFGTPGILADELKKVLPEVEMASAFNWSTKSTFQVGDKILKEEGRAAGADFFSMFTYPLIQGTPATALSTPVSIAVSRKMAVDFFGSAEAAIGQAITFENKKQYKVTGVFENLPGNTSSKFDYLISWTAWLEDNSWAKDWGNNGPQCFILLRKDANPANFTKKLTHFLDKYNKDQGKTFHIEMGMERFGDVYLHGSFVNGRIEGGRIGYVRLFTIVAIFILLIACINFMNLTTARSLRRAKEIGIRKVVGAVRPALIRQFFGEAIVLSTFSIIVALGMVLLLLPGFNQLTGKQIAFPFGVSAFWLSLLALTLITGIVSGSYPALFLSAFQPIRVLKGSMKFSAGATWFRKGLVVFQFVLSIMLIIGTIVVSQQVDYVQSIDLGYDRENLVYIPMEGDLPANYKPFREAALQIPGVAAVTHVNQDPTNLENGTGGVDWDGKSPDNLVMFTNVAVGYNFVTTMKLRLQAGREFSPAYLTDTSGYMINEEALRRMGYKHPIGQRLTMWGKKGTIVGVVKDFHFTSLHESIKPLIIRFGEDSSSIKYGSIILRIQGGRTRQTLASLEQLCHTMNPKFPFSYTFADDEYRELYKSESIVHSLANCFAALAIIICCLGLLGLTMFTAEQRTKEFGIRKVLGARPGTLFGLLSQEFLMLVVVAFLLASPIAFWAMYEWLKNFAYHTSLHWWVLLLAGMIALMIALLTVSFQAVKVAMANPIKSLRTE